MKTIITFFIVFIFIFLSGCKKRYVCSCDGAVFDGVGAISKSQALKKCKDTAMRNSIPTETCTIL